MTLKLDGFFVAVTKNCDCKGNAPQIGDGYVIRTRCEDCHGKGFLHQKVSLTDLKAWLDGYGG